jgi:opacity protein-like surface antigen
MTLVALLASTAALAEDDAAQDRSGPYLGLSFGIGFTTFNEDLTPITDPDGAGAGPVDVDDSLALMVRAGYRLTPLIAAELQYEWFEEATYESDTAILRPGKPATGYRSFDPKVETHIVTANARFIAAIDAPAQPYALFGFGAGYYDIDTVIEDRQTWEAVGRIAGGVDFYVTEHVVFVFEAGAIFSTRKLLDETVPYVSVTGGLQYRF